MDNNLFDLAKKIVKLSKHYVTTGSRYWNLTHPFFEEEKVPEPDINGAFNEWNWAEKELINALISYEEEETKQKREEDKKAIQQIFNNDTDMETKKEFTRFTLETSYGDKTIKELDTEDPQIEDCVHAFFTLMIGSTWQPVTILEEMKRFAESNLAALDRNRLYTKEEPTQQD